MQRPAVKRIKLIIQKGTNDNLASTCLSGANVFTRVVSSGIFWRTWPRSMCVYATIFLSATITKDLSCKHYCQASFFISRFVRRPRDYRIQRQSFSEQIVLFHVFRSNMAETQQQQHFYFFHDKCSYRYKLWCHSHIVFAGQARLSILKIIPGFIKRVDIVNWPPRNVPVKSTLQHHPGQHPGNLKFLENFCSSLLSPRRKAFQVPPP